MYVIHYFNLEDLIEVVTDGGHAGRGVGVHVENVKTVRPGSIAGMADHVSFVHVRAVVDGAIRVWMTRIGSVQTLHGRPFGDEAQAAEVAKRSDQAGALVRARLEGAGCKVRPGLIDIHPAEPVRGYWAGLDRLFEEVPADG